ncbi:MAG: RNB domain-containing ribonuclease [Oligosphaeraceae bacterium]
MGYAVNHIVDYIGNGELCLGVVVKDQGERIQVQGPTKQVAKVSLKQVVADYGRCPTNNPLPALTALQNEIAALQEEIDAAFLWETLVESAPGSRPLSAQAEEYFGASPTSRQCSALGRALMADPLHFRYDGTDFAPNSPEEIARLEELRRQRAEKAALRERTRQWLAQAIGAEEAACLQNPLPVPEEMESFLGQCTDYLLRGLNAPAVNLLATAGSRLTPRELALSLLRKTRRMPKDADEFLLANGIHAGFSQDVLTAADALAPYENSPLRETLQGMEIFSIDDQWTREIDDALSLQRLPDGNFLVGIHLANPSSFVKKGDPLDQAAVDRPLSLYLPTTTVTMFPERLGCDLASLNQGELRPAFSVMVTLDAQGEIQDWRIAPTQLAITRRLTYIQADELLARGENDPLSQALKELRRLAECRQRFREECGAIQLNRPELKLHVENGEITAEWDDQNTPSHELVSEFMVLANHLAARYALRNDVPILYRCQELPAEDAHSVRVYDPVDFDQQVRKMKRTRLSTYPEGHGGLGLDLYTQISSPLRRYADMVIQRQLCAHLAGDPLPYTQTELFGVLDNVDRTASGNRALEREARGFWTMELLRRQEPGRTYPATVVRVEGRLVLAELSEYLVRGVLMVRDAPPLGQRLTVRIQEVKPKLNRLVLEPA